MKQLFYSLGLFVQTFFWWLVISLIILACVGNVQLTDFRYVNF